MSVIVLDNNIEDNSEIVDTTHCSLFDSIGNTCACLVFCFCNPIIICGSCCGEFFKQEPCCAFTLLIFVFIGIPGIIWGITESQKIHPTFLPTIMNITNITFSPSLRSSI